MVNVAEAFTILASNGMSLNFFTTEGMDIQIQQTVMDVQMALEDGVERILRARGKPAVMMCDRGTMDGSAYMAKETWEALLADRNTTETEIRDNRYNAVFHVSNYCFLLDIVFFSSPPNSPVLLQKST